MSSNPGFHKSPFVRVLELPQTKAWLSAALARWEGGTILQIGLRDPIVAVELARRGARVTGIDSDPNTVTRARDLLTAGKVNSHFDTFELKCGSLTSAGSLALEPFMNEPADVAVVESLPEGAAITVALETLLKCARAVVISTELRPSIPDRFIKDTIATSEFTFTISANSQSQDCATNSFVGLIISDPTDASRGEQNGDAPFARALEDAGDNTTNLQVAVVRDAGLSPSRLEPVSLAMREPNATCSVAATSVRTDRFSREHVTALLPFDELWFPGASIRSLAIECGIEAARGRVIRDAVDTYQFTPRPKIQQNFRVLAMAGSARRMTEAVFAARVFTETFRETPNAILTILLGDGLTLEHIRGTLTKELGSPLPSNIEFMGPVAHEDMPKFYCEFDLFLRPSTGERRATAILEAMACGVPVAATRFGLAGEIVNIQNGYPIEAGAVEVCDPSVEYVTADEAGHHRPTPSVNSTKEALLAAHEDWQGRLQRAGAAREYVVKNHSIAAVAEMIRNIPWDTTNTEDTVTNETVTSSVHYDSLEAAAAATGEMIYCDNGKNPAPPVSEIERAFTAKELWCYSPLTAQGWVAAGYPAGKIQIAPPVVAGDSFQRNVRPAVLPTRRKVRILVDARQDYTSGADLALLAFSEAKITNGALVVMGACAQTRASLEKLATAQGGAVEVVFVAEPGSEVARASLYTACDLVLDLSRGASDGKFILEAAACGRPAVAAPFAHPPGIVTNATSYPIPAKLRISMTSMDQFAAPPILCETNVEETARILKFAVNDTTGRKRRCDAAAKMAETYRCEKLATFVANRRAAFTAPEMQEVTLAFAAPAGTAAPELPSDSLIIQLEGKRVRGGLAQEASDTLAAVERDFIIFASGNLNITNPDGGNWARPLVEPLACDPSVALTIAKDTNGVIVAMRPRILRTVQFAHNFETPAFLIQFAKDLMDRGERVVPVSELTLTFCSTDPRFTREAEAALQLAQAEEALHSSDSEGGLDLLLSIVQKHPRFGAALETAASVFEALGEYNESIEARRACARFAPRDPVAHAKLGELCIFHGDAKEAMQHLRAARALAPEDALVAHSYGKALLKCGRFAEAAEEFLCALNLEPDFTDAAAGAADALQQMGKSADAMTLLKNFELTPAEPRGTGTPQFV